MQYIVTTKGTDHFESFASHKQAANRAKALSHHYRKTFTVKTVRDEQPSKSQPKHALRSTQAQGVLF